MLSPGRRQLRLQFMLILTLVFIVAGLPAGNRAAQAAEPASLRLVPFPKEVRLESGSFSLARPLILDVPNAQSERLGQLLNEELKRAGLPAAQVRGLDSPSPAFRLAANQAALKLPSLPNNDAAEAYAIDIRDDEVVCVAREPGGVVFGLQTLCQLIRANRQNDAIPCLSVRDWPSLRWRCFQDDMTRGPSSSLDTLKFEAALGSYLKLNLMTFYMEYQYAFRKHPKIGPPNGSLTPDELTALVDYVKPLRLNILGNQQSFGHFGQILKHPEYAQLRETRDVLAPVREETYQLLDDLYSEVCPLLPFPWFNVCCDETWGLGTGPSKELAAKIGVGGVYVRHIQRVHDLLRDKYKKRMMMWGDIILQHPGNLKDIPKDTLMLTWGYDARANFEDQIVPFAKSGYEFFVCPGVSNWNRILPDFGIAQINIRNFVRDGVKHGAIGMINTDWKDDGESLSAVKWHADAWAAECAWNASATTPEAFNRRIGAVLFGEAEDHFGQAVELLAKAHRLPGMKDMMNSRFWEKDFAPAAGPARIQATATSLLAVVRPAIQNLEACRREARCNEHVLDTLLFGARRMELIGQRMLDGLQAAQLYAKLSEHPQQPKAIEPIEQLIQKNRDVHEALAKEFATLWRVESKPYALDWTLARYARTVEDYSALLRKLADARSAATAGRPLPSPEEIGLPIPKPLARLIRPREVLATPLSPDLPWADPAATHRLGLVISAADADRFDLPVEVELALPNDLAGKPVRAFQIGDREHQRELLPQLDGSGQVDKRRLILLLPGPLPKGTEASVHVYLGLPVPPPPLATAACTHAGPSAMHWLENDRVRLLLGDEGSHVYRWEVKSLANRDLTMPGESGWAGFSDMATHRHSRYQIACTSRGPAMVEFQCTDEIGHSKTLRLYGGMSWIEVLLSEPTPLYWDIDNPKNFAADGPTPGTWLFSTGQTGRVGREADGVPAQVKAAGARWGIKYNDSKLALGLVTPETAALHHVAPGAGAGGVGIENSPPAQHFVTFAGVLDTTPTETMTRLQTTLNLKRPVGIRLHSLQAHEK